MAKKQAIDASSEARLDAVNFRWVHVRRRSKLAFAAGVIFIIGVLVGSHLHPAKPTLSAESQLAVQVQQLQSGLKRLEAQELAPAQIIAANRNSICFIVSTYRLTAASAPGFTRRFRLLATGFLLPGNLVASNRHVMEPWFGDPQAERLIHMGLLPLREKIIAYFPGFRQGVELSQFAVSKDADVAVAKAKLPASMSVRPLLLASGPIAPGDPVVVIGYPLGVTTLVAKSAAIPYESSEPRRVEEDFDELAQFKLIRPSATQGHVSDVINTTLMYDASTAHGSSGGPVFNIRGEVIGVDAALIDGFRGASLGVTTAALRPLLTGAEHETPSKAAR